MTRTIQRELLDDLSPEDPRAIRSRSDLRRLNTIMGHVSLFSAALAGQFTGKAPHVIAELGAGDGWLMLQLARRLGSRWPGTRVLLLDQHNVVSPDLLNAFGSHGWEAEAVTADVFDWLSAERACDALVANLFLHHFTDAQLAEMFRLASSCAPFFVACEPRRSPSALVASCAVGLIGCNSVTRHDAPASVRAGFSGSELSGLWPADGGWRRIERRAGLFSHFFSAKRGSLQ